MTAGRVHHSAIQVGDVDASLRFYRDGIGLDVLMDHVFEGDWPALFAAPSAVLRSIFLGDRTHPDVGIVELVVFDGPGPVSVQAGPASEQADPASEQADPASVPSDPVSDAPAPAGPAPAPVSGPGFFLLSFYVDVDEVLARLAALGFGPARRIEQPAPTGAVTMACVYDPDGVRVELVGVPAASEQTVPAASGETVPTASEQTVPTASEQTVPTASGETVPTASG